MTTAHGPFHGHISDRARDGSHVMVTRLSGDVAGFDGLPDGDVEVWSAVNNGNGEPYARHLVNTWGAGGLRAWLDEQDPWPAAPSVADQLRDDKLRVAAAEIRSVADAARGHALDQTSNRAPDELDALAAALDSYVGLRTGPGAIRPTAPDSDELRAALAPLVVELTDGGVDHELLVDRLTAAVLGAAGTDTHDREDQRDVAAVPIGLADLLDGTAAVIELLDGATLRGSAGRYDKGELAETLRRTADDCRMAPAAEATTGDGGPEQETTPAVDPEPEDPPRRRLTMADVKMAITGAHGTALDRVPPPCDWASSEWGRIAVLLTDVRIAPVLPERSALAEAVNDALYGVFNRWWNDEGDDLHLTDREGLGELVSQLVADVMVTVTLDEGHRAQHRAVKVAERVAACDPLTVMTRTTGPGVPDALATRLLQHATYYRDSLAGSVRGDLVHASEVIDSLVVALHGDSTVIGVPIRPVATGPAGCPSCGADMPDENLGTCPDTWHDPDPVEIPVTLGRALDAARHVRRGTLDGPDPGVLFIPRDALPKHTTAAGDVARQVRRHLAAQSGAVAGGGPEVRVVDDVDAAVAEWHHERDAAVTARIAAKLADIRRQITAEGRCPGCAARPGAAHGDDCPELAHRQATPEPDRLRDVAGVMLVAYGLTADRAAQGDIVVDYVRRRLRTGADELLAAADRLTDWS